jgi:dolichol-phosphate mannosyltransferase
MLEPRKLSFLSIVIPIFNEEDSLSALRDSLDLWLLSLGDIKTEIILVNDGSNDASLHKCVEWAHESKDIKVISLSRNFGHQLAVSAGLGYASGEAVVVMDADLQDPFDVIHEMIKRYEDGYDVAYGQRNQRKGETRFKLGSAWLFYRLMRHFVHKDLPVDTGDFRLISRRCVDALNSMPESQRFLRGMIAWMGFSQVAVPYTRNERQYGETKYPLRKMLFFAWNAITSFSSFPVRVISFCGLMSALAGFFICLWILYQYLSGETVRGWASMTGLITVIGGFILISLGIIGDYVGKIYDEVKGRPLFLVEKTFNITDNKNLPAHYSH